MEKAKKHDKVINKGVQKDPMQNHASQKIHPMTQTNNKDEQTAVNVNEEEDDYESSDSDDEGMGDIP